MAILREPRSFFGGYMILEMAGRFFGFGAKKSLDRLTVMC